MTELKKQKTAEQKPDLKMSVLKVSKFTSQLNVSTNLS